MNLVCTSCGQEIPDGAKAVFGIMKDGQFIFGWTCCHKPTGDAEIVFGSRSCLMYWLAKNPKYESSITRMLEAHAKQAHS